MTTKEIEIVPGGMRSNREWLDKIEADTFRGSLPNKTIVLGMCVALRALLDEKDVEPDAPTGEELNPVWLEGGVKVSVCNEGDGVLIQLTRDQQTFSFSIGLGRLGLLVRVLRQALAHKR